MLTLVRSRVDSVSSVYKDAYENYRHRQIHKNLVSKYTIYKYSTLVQNLHVSRVAETSVTRLTGTFVETHLQVQVSLTGTKLILREGSLILVGHLRS